MKAFTPLQIAKNMPKVRALLLLRKLLLEQQGNLDNRKEFRRLVRRAGPGSEGRRRAEEGAAGLQRPHDPPAAALRG